MRFLPIHRYPRIGSRGRTAANQATLRGNHKFGRVGLQCFSNDALGIAGTIDIGCIYEVDSKFCRTAKYSPRVRLVLWRTPNPRPGELHRTVTHAMDWQVATDAKYAAQWGFLFC